MREFRAQGPCSCSAVSFNLGGGVFAQVSRGSRPECAGAAGTVLRHNAATARTTRQLAARIRRARESERDRQTDSKIPRDAVALRAARTTGSAQKSAKTKSQSRCTSLCTSRPSQLNILKAQSLHPARGSHTLRRLGVLCSENEVRARRLLEAERHSQSWHRNRIR